MALCRFRRVLSGINIPKSTFSTSSSLGYKWRRKLQIEHNPYMYSPITLLPDYSHVDGRPITLSENRKKKLELQRKYCERIKELSHELDVAKQLYAEKQKQLQEDRENILRNKLKPKGAALLSEDQEKK